METQSKTPISTHTPGPWKVLPRPLPSGTKYEIWQAKPAKESWRVGEVVFQRDAALVAEAPAMVLEIIALLERPDFFNLAVNGHLLNDDARAEYRHSLLKAIPEIYDQFQPIIARIAGLK